MLISINPYHHKATNDSQNYGPEIIAKYMGSSQVKLPPHIYAIGENWRQFFYGRSWPKTLKSTILNLIELFFLGNEGLTGAGKTEATKHLIQFLCSNGNFSSDNITDKIRIANDLLEIFGNASTIANINSSRFSKFFEVSKPK